MVLNRSRIILVINISSFGMADIVSLQNQCMGPFDFHKLLLFYLLFFFFLIHTHKLKCRCTIRFPNGACFNLAFYKCYCSLEILWLLKVTWFLKLYQFLSTDFTVYKVAACMNKKVHYYQVYHLKQKSDWFLQS